jgi:phenylpyruvate tautomerase PptA (4-oxalocrotonate tautomerase family)
MLGFLVPVVRIRALPQPGVVDLPAVLGRVSRALADLLGERPERTWATWETIGSGHYAEGGRAPAEQPRGTHPPLVRMLAFEGRPPELIERMLVCVAETLAHELDLEPGNVFVTYEEARSGRVYDGGRVVKRASED